MSTNLGGFFLPKWKKGVLKLDFQKTVVFVLGIFIKIEKVYNRRNNVFLKY